MFDFFKSKKCIDVQGPMRRVIDVVSPNMPRMDEVRYYRRYPRVLPVMISLMDKERPNLEARGIGMSHNLSDEGFGIIGFKPFEVADTRYTLTVWPEKEEFTDPYHFIGSPTHCQPFCYGMWTIGFRLEDMIDNTSGPYTEVLKECAMQMLRPQEAEVASGS